MIDRIGPLLRLYWPILITLVIGAAIVGYIGIVAESTNGAMWAGGAIGVAIGMIVAWQQGRRDPSRKP